MLTIEQRHVKLCRRARPSPFREPVLNVDAVELDSNALDPLLIWLTRRELLLKLSVIDDAALLGVDQKHLARLQTPLLDDTAFGNRQHADLGRHHDHVVIGDDVARGAQAVAIERRADANPVGKRYCSRPIPRLHHCGVVLVERAPRLVHQRVLLPRFRNHHHHRVRDRIPAHDQQLERIVETRGIGLAFVNQRKELCKIPAQHR